MCPVLSLQMVLLKIVVDMVAAVHGNPILHQLSIAWGGDQVIICSFAVVAKTCYYLLYLEDEAIA